ncbi:50S ribosomal protein L4 [Candidatus Pacearchaeota archaeon]|nr:50S ribosomal protein L4 [Candidatus Pacearchaeota archaeon]
MKATLYSVDGKKKSQIEMPKMFSQRIREDIVVKYFEADKFIQPYSSFKDAGNRQSASGTISHKRHDWKGHYGQGRSRAPRKTMSRRGNQFFWIGASVPGARGGRRAHPPKGIGKEKKINKKEIVIAFNSAFASTASQYFVSKRYPSLEKINPPFVVAELPQKTKDIVKMLKNVFDENYQLVLKQKSIRAGKGKSRGRKYKSNAGALIIVSDKEIKNVKGFDIKSTRELAISDLYPLGRLTLYTQKAIEELGKEGK